MSDLDRRLAPSGGGIENLGREAQASLAAIVVTPAVRAHDHHRRLRRLAVPRLPADPALTADLCANGCTCYGVARVVSDV
jgi:hypothetical protein